MQNIDNCLTISSQVKRARNPIILKKSVKYENLAVKNNCDHDREEEQDSNEIHDFSEL